MTAGGRVVWITGAAGGLGGALVKRFAAAGWRVVAAGHRQPPGFSESSVWNCVLDVTCREDCKRLVSSTLERWRRLDVLVNNAGVVRDGLLRTLTDDDWDQAVGVNLKGAFLCSQAVLPTMVAQRDGHILNISSFSGRCGGLGQANYAAAKAGLIGLTLSLAREVGESGVRVNAVLPGLLPTRLTLGLSEGTRAGLVGANVLGRMNRFEEVAGLMVQLAGTRDVSGQVFQWDSRIGRWA